MTTIPQDELVCSWPVCDRSGDKFPLLSIDDRSWWCLDHIDDEFLPPLEVGGLKGCAVCEKGCIHHQEGTPLHPWCQRHWALTQISRPMVGAYARRKR